MNNQEFNFRKGNLSIRQVITEDRSGILKQTDVMELDPISDVWTTLYPNSEKENEMFIFMHNEKVRLGIK